MTGHSHSAFLAGVYSGQFYICVVQCGPTCIQYQQEVNVLFRVCLYNVLVFAVALLLALTVGLVAGALLFAFVMASLPAFVIAAVVMGILLLALLALCRCSPRHHK